MGAMKLQGDFFWPDFIDLEGSERSSRGSRKDAFAANAGGDMSLQAWATSSGPPPPPPPSPPVVVCQTLLNFPSVQSQALPDHADPKNGNSQSLPPPPPPPTDTILQAPIGTVLLDSTATHGECPS